MVVDFFADLLAKSVHARKEFPAVESHHRESAAEKGFFFRRDYDTGKVDAIIAKLKVVFESFGGGILIWERVREVAGLLV